MKDETGFQTFLCYNADYVVDDEDNEYDVEDLDLNLCGKKGSSHLTEEKLNAYQDEMSESLEVNHS